jgi:hypothetical protein
MELVSRLHSAIESDSTAILLRCLILIVNYLCELSSDRALPLICTSVRRLVASWISSVTEAMLDKLPEMLQILISLKGSKYCPGCRRGRGRQQPEHGECCGTHSPRDYYELLQGGLHSVRAAVSGHLTAPMVNLAGDSDSSVRLSTVD